MRALPLAAGLMLAACANGAREELPAPQLPQRAGVDATVAARAEGIEFRAVGEGFVLDIFREERIRFARTPSGEELNFPKPAPRYPRWNGVIYETESETHTLTIRIRDDRRCESADRALYPTRVELMLDGMALSGCGRRF